MNKGLSLLFSLGCYALGNSLICNSAIAQVTPDGTTNTMVNPDGNNNFTIENGDRAGGNLFHSFDQFSVPNGGSAVFNNAPEIENIFSRVTGGNISNINGLIQANDANLFLVNPAGILFGNNARLDIGGSFLGTTADSILFEDGEFSATDFDNPPLLTINAPIGLNFRDNPQPITNKSIADDMGLQVDTGNNVTLVGGDIFFDGGVTFAPGGRVELGGLAEEGIVSFNDDLSLNFSEDLTRANVSLTNEAVINVRADSGGSIAINSRNLEILEGSKIRAGIASGLGSPQSLAGNIDVNSTETVTIAGANTFIANAVLEGALGKAGDVKITTESLSLSDGGQANSLTQGQGNAGNVNVTASDISLDGVDNEGDRSGFFSTVDSGALGDGGEINIKTASLSIINGAGLIGATFGEGNAGNVNIQADTLSFDGVGSNGLLSGVFNNVEEGGVGNAGSIEITTGSLSLTNGAQLAAATFGQGNAGFVTIEANTLSLDGVGSNGFVSGIFSFVAQKVTGNAQDINIKTSELSLSNSAIISASTSGRGNGGNILVRADSLTLTDGGRIAANVNSTGQGNAGILDIVATDSISVDGKTPEGFPTAITSVVDRFFAQEGVGNAGGINITTSQLSLTNGGRVSATSLGQGNGGDLTINATESIFISGFTESFRSGIAVDALVNDGNSGNANIFTDQLTITNGGTIEASNFDSLGVFDPGTGEPGNIEIEANSINLTNGGRIEAGTQSETGKGANINLQVADNITLQDNSFISAQALGNADGGNLTIDTNFIIAFPNQINGNGSDIIASAVQGEGGGININAESLFGIQEREAIDNNQTNDIDASSRFSLDGNVSINTPDINPIQGATELPTNIVEPDQTVAQACAASRNTSAANSFVVKGKGGIAPLPTAPLDPEMIMIDGKLVANPTDSAMNSGYAILTSQGYITPARGVIKTEDGQIILTSMPISGHTSRTPNSSINCGKV